ncbi:MAG TPA: type II toxin-antitoxin system RelE/ParE family toxin [Rudaea sp.]|jgi:proteic killer suppression protein|uniref:type II toxin-antitoxin system RelE/ParE family toxin n=1 Tax=Rudaea sp. TaxID=2136325 RepID=UPI002F929967
MILGFRCKDTQALFEGGDPRRFRAIKEAAMRKLTELDAANTLEFLRSPPGNQLEALKHDRVGQHNIRINRQWRLCFVWTTAGPTNVEIVNYH